MTGSGLGLSMARSNSRIRCMTIAMALATAPCPAWAQTIHTFIDFADQRPPPLPRASESGRRAGAGQRLYRQ
jgi:hypothetical protein